MADLATLRIVVDSSGAIRAVDQFGNAAEDATKQVEAMGASAKRIGAAVGTVLVAGLALAIKNTAEAEKVQAQLAAALRSTGNAAGQTLESLNDHAEALSRLTAFGDEAIGSAQALLLTFTKIQGDVFPLATQAVLDLATALGGDVRGAAIQVGKALNDPILGVTALSKAGVQFSPIQKAMIKGFVETNQMAKAQGVILAELNTQVAGSAAAYRNTLGGAIDGLRESFGNLFEVSSPGMVTLVANINTLADSMGLFATQSALATAQLDRFLAKSNTKILGALSTVSFGLLGNDGAGSGFDLKTQQERLARAEADIAALLSLIAEQKASIAASLAARAAAGTGGGLSGGRTGTPDPVIVAAAAEAIDKFNRNLKAMTKAVDDDTALREKQDTRTKAALAKTAEAVAELSEAAKTFREQTQIAVGRFFSDFFREGTSSFKRFWENISQVGFDLVGNVLAKKIMEGASRFLDSPMGQKAGAALFGVAAGTASGSALGGAAGGALGGFVTAGPLGAVLGGVTGLISGFIEQGKRAAEAAEAQRRALAIMRENLAAANRSLNEAIADFGGGLDDRTRMASRRDAIARDAQNVLRQTAGYNILTQFGRDSFGSFEDFLKYYQEAAQRNPSNVAIREFVKQLEALDQAFRSSTIAAENAAKIEAFAARQRQAASLTQFRDGLSLSAQSPLSPTAQLAEARRQYEVILALAKGGDQSAISSLPETARTLLDASRAVNASGVRYAQDFARVQTDTQAIIEQLRTQRAEDTLDASEFILERTEPWFASQLAATEATLAVQQSGFQSVVDELVNVRTEISVMKNALKLSLEEMAAAS